MRSTIMAALVLGALAVTAADVYAMSGGGRRHSGGSGGNGSSSSSSSYSGGTASVPEPSTLYAAGCALTALAAAGWYIRRRR